ncbi:quinolinate synthase NadA [Candidatus Bipolaricaulota bacterium]|nr:quinolinate synthase NadA [Candidatus Bipolaricaulota bacterium]
MGDYQLEEAATKIQEVKEKLGEDLLILAHHYQRDEIVAVADFRGDSLELSRRAADSDARWIVFCGVHFMAETAAILARPGQQVLIPREDAGCYLAHSVDRVQLLDAWERLSQVMHVERELLPVAYVNTTAEVKAFVGEKGGACCTSSSANQVLTWAFERSPRVFFLPDQYLGRNTASALGIPEEEIALWDPHHPPQDLSRFKRARLVLWRGACNVHVRFLPQDVARVRREQPGVLVVVHPECRPEVVALADEVGSTSYIIRTVKNSPPGTVWAVGTEQRLVARLAAENLDKLVFSLGDPPPYCSYMSLTRLSDLARVLAGLPSGEERGRVEVPAEVRAGARAALDRMWEAIRASG